MLDKEWICLIFFLFFVFGIILGKFKYYWYIDMIVLLFYYEWILKGNVWWYVWRNNKDVVLIFIIGIFFMDVLN